MKNTQIVALVFLTLGITSCTKIQNSAVVPIQEEQSVTSSVQMAGKLRALWHYDPWRMNCVAIVQNCHPVDIIIKPSLYDVYSSFFSVLEGQNDDRIKDFIEANMESLLEDIPADLLDKTLDGTYVARYFYSAPDNLKFVLFKSGEAVVMAMPYVTK